MQKYILTDAKEITNQMKTSTKKIIVIAIIVLFIVSMITGILVGHL
jgi:flagellar basal body-associated protein FliL